MDLLWTENRVDRKSRKHPFLFTERFWFTRIMFTPPFPWSQPTNPSGDYRCGGSRTTDLLRSDSRV